MIQLRGDVMKVHNPTTGLYEGLNVARGQSTYEIAKAQGYTGTEEKFIREHTPDEILAKLLKLEAELKVSGAELDGIQIFVRNGAFMVGFDDEDNTSHSGKVGNMIISVHGGAVYVTYDEVTA